MRKLAMLVLVGLGLACRADGTDSKEETRGAACAAAAEKPTCCEGCGYLQVMPVCTDGSWSCPAGSKDERQCPNATCSLPLHPQEAYTYPGCANEDYGCPRLKTVYCALESLRTERAACAQDSDCVAAGVNGRCTGYGECPPAMVNAAHRAEFQARAAEEVLRYCGESPMCASTGQCAYPSFVPRCKEGRCVAEPGDAGT
ncbi:hypothetical protein ACLESD_12915 [Pyxidicoccus sp. 3LFB2]